MLANYFDRFLYIMIAAFLLSQFNAFIPFVIEKKSS